MQADYIGATGFALALMAHGVLAVLVFLRRDRIPASGALQAAALVGALWATAWLSAELGLLDLGWPSFVADLLRGFAWLVVVLSLLGAAGGFVNKRAYTSVYGVLALAAVVLPVAYWLGRSEVPTDVRAWVAGGYALSLLTLLSAEQVFRNASPELRSSTTYLCIAIAGFFVFDLVFFVTGIAGAPLDPDMMSARGYINALLTLPLLLGVWRRSETVSEGRLPRRIVLYSFGAIVLSLYVVVAIVGYQYVHEYGGAWADVGGIVLASAAGAGGVVLLASASLRSRVRVALMKTFFQYKYDYREEWLRFIATLSESGFDNVAATVVRAVAQIVNSPGGVLLVAASDDDAYSSSGVWPDSIAAVPSVPRDSALVGFLVSRQWVIDLEELRDSPTRYGGLEVSDWLTEGNKWWLIVPVFLGRRLLGLIVLLKPRVAPSLNFEDHDLLKTVGRHVGMHINQAESDRRLAESRQFGAYNRLTAFLMHDLNNLIAQQSLVVSNAERHRDNPEFVDDAIDTIANSVSRMRSLMEQLSRGSSAPRNERVDVSAVLRRVVADCENRQPAPQLSSSLDRGFVYADPARIASVFEHLIRNAQDATPASGEVTVDMQSGYESVQVSITDTGTGMTQEFVRDHLFRPFESTKGSESMGIGAYQAKEYLRSLGGQLDVTSQVDEGTTFTVQLPRSD